ncbi:MAG: transcription-repair coupling factor [Nitrospiraceae bacterium]|nr:transcription-repair coupling factor [Nitrospiraceae bacterium]
MLLLKAFEEFKKGVFPSLAVSSRIHGLRGTAAALLLAMAAGQPNEKPIFCAAPRESDALKLQRDAGFYLCLLGGGAGEVFLLPEPDGPEISGKRAEFALSARSKTQKKIIVASKAALSAPLWPAEVLEGLRIQLSYPGSFERQALENRLAAMGYKPVPLVGQPGQFRMKGWILDVFPAGLPDPVRVEFFGDDIDSMRFFDVESQLHTEEVFQLSILPVKEPDRGEPADLGVFAGRLFALEDASGMPEGAITLSRLPLTGAHEETGFGLAETGLPETGLLPLSGYGLLHNERRDITELPAVVKRLRDSGAEILFVLSSATQAERVKNILWEDGLHMPVLDPEDVPSYEGGLCATPFPGGLSAGFAMSFPGRQDFSGPNFSGQKPGLFIVTDRELFGEKPAWKPMKKSRISGLLQTIDDLQGGDYVVHSEHGVGRFMGFAREAAGEAGTTGTAGAAKTDLLIIEYAEGARIYLPLYGIEKIHKYKTPEGGVKPQLDRLGGKAWERRKARVKKRLREMAEKLLKIYAGRAVAKGFAFSPDTELHREFDNFFPYEVTPDQARAIAEVKKDMEEPRPMERLLCGDVGYGKTEVAMRAAFKAVYDARQAVVIVPTTLLCEQHFRTFSGRFAAFPVRIDFASRFKSKAENRLTFEAFEKGEVDILIATHSIFRAGLSFKNLGLLVVDEEHRFGVAQKERIKELSRGVDALMLTATPIPRTFQMALAGVRDFSVIETPPEERLAVKSTIAVFSKTVISEAVSAELARGGQVFFVHNRIEDIEKIMGLLRGLFPAVRMGLAHGRMKESELERVMIKFMDGELDLLLSTAIIGSGIDIPTANTIIVDRADMMGLADLYQLRGRVGRGSVAAHAWFLIPGGDIITEDAKKRLQALEELSYLGAGFRVAMKDLEIRGAGNMLGPEQSGYINDLGFEMYMELLERAVAELKGIEIREKVMPSVELKVDALIPDSYIEDISLRLGFYRRIAASGDAGQLRKIARECSERFGPLPEELKNLIQVMSLRIASERASVAGIEQMDGRARFRFLPGASPPVDEILKIFGGRLKFIPEGFEVLVSERMVLRDVSEVLGHLTEEKDFVIF